MKTKQYPQSPRQWSKTFPDGSKLIRRNGGYEIMEARPQYQAKRKAAPIRNRHAPSQ